jgi:YidC/Oxa1 family membrane protein insertase
MNVEKMDKMSQNMRLVVASALAALIILVWQIYFVDPMLAEQEAARQEAIKLAPKPEVEAPKLVARSQALVESNRVKFTNGTVSGSINLVGARIDDLVLDKYHQDLDHKSEKVVLLSPSKAEDSYFIEFGWVSAASGIALPDSTTVWHASKSSIAPGDQLELTHTNAQGVKFIIKLSLDEHYMFHVKQSVVNRSGGTLELSNYSLTSRVASKPQESNVVIHEGAIGVFDDTLTEVKFADLQSSQKMDMKKADWLGFSDKYWLAALIPTQKDAISARFSFSNKSGVARYQASFSSDDVQSIAPGSTADWAEVMIFAGAKELDVLDEYESKYNLKLFDRAVDFGVLYFITKPLFQLLHILYDLVGNFGVAILLMTVLVKLALFPLAHKGFKGMNKLKELQPKMEAIKQQYKDDAAAFQKALLEMYKKEKVNPMGGCLPILLQIPIFFALYKVLYVTIEMRHAPFMLWIHDLSAPDPYTIFNLFGLIPWAPPQFLMIGILPIMMALSLYFQQQLSPAPTDPTQAKIMKFLPLILLFMFSSFPSGLVIYWTWSNILSIMQQLMIKKLEGGGNITNRVVVIKNK